jgi:hypothetical protein
MIMSDKVVDQLTTGKMSKPDWVTDMGHHNAMPEPCREIDIHRFLHMVGIYNPKAIDRRQIIVGPNSAMESTTIFWFHNCGMAFVHPSKWDCKPEGGIEYDLSQCKFFEIGCDHKYGELTQKECRERGMSHYGHCWHVMECTT